MARNYEQRKLFQAVASKQAVRGYFYVDGKRLIKKMCSFSEAGLDKEGKLQKKTKSAISSFTTKMTRLHSKIQAELEEQKEHLSSTVITIKELFSDWIKVSEVDKAPRTIKHHYIPTANGYLKIVGDHDISSTDLTKIDKFKLGLKDSGLAPASINIKLRTFKTFLNWCVDRGHLAKVPKMKMIKTVTKLPGVLSQEDLGRLYDRIHNLSISESNPRNRRFFQCHKRFFMIISGTGCRLQEVFWLRWDQVNFERSTITILTNTRFTVKEKKDKEKIIPSRVLAYLREERHKYPDEIYVFDDGNGALAYKDPHSFSTAFSRHFKALGITGVKAVHGFRATFATTMKNDLGVDISVIKNLLGHSDTRVTEGYFSNIDEPQRAAIEALDNLNPSLV